MGVELYELLEFSSGDFSFRLNSNPSAPIPSNNRFTVVIGANGSGKSKLLRAIAEYELEERADLLLNGFIRRPTQVLAVSNLVTDSFPFEARKRQNRYRYLGLRQATNAVTTGSLRSSTTTFIAGCLFSKERQNALTAVLDELEMTRCDVVLRPRRGSRYSPSELLRALESRRPDSGMPSMRVYESLISVIEQASKEELPSEYWLKEFNELAFELDMDFAEFLPLIRRSLPAELVAVVYSKRNRLDVAELSTGQLLLLSTCARIAATISNDSLVLIDEPETGLHPTWQANYISLLRRTIEGFQGSHFFIATHSPHIVSDASDVLVPGGNWGEFQEFEDPFYGRSLENILYRVFGVSTAGNPMVERDLSTLLRTIARADLGGNVAISANDSLERLRRVAGSDTVELNQLLDDAARILGAGN